MDIVSRLKTFIDYLGIPVTQFADNCKMPRPTLSQLLNGRNKTIRDEIIAKIHEAYPQLSIMWLLFGEGPLLADKKLSPVNTDKVEEQPKASLFGRPSIPFTPAADDESENIPGLDVENGANADAATPTHDTKAIVFSDEANEAAGHKSEPPTSGKTEATMLRTIHFNTEPTAENADCVDGNRRIVNIIVYYSDNSFESFVPGNI